MKIVRTAIVAATLTSLGLGSGSFAGAAPLGDLPVGEIPTTKPLPSISDWYPKPETPCGFDGSIVPATPVPHDFAELDVDGDGIDDVVLAYFEASGLQARVRVDTASGVSSEVTFQSDLVPSILGVIEFGTGHAVLVQSSNFTDYLNVTAVSIDADGCAFVANDNVASSLGYKFGSRARSSTFRDGVRIVNRFGVSCREGRIFQHRVSIWKTEAGTSKYSVATTVATQTSARRFEWTTVESGREINEETAKKLLVHDCPGAIPKA